MELHFCYMDFPAGNYMFKVNNRNTRTRYEIERRRCSFDHLIAGWVVRSLSPCIAPVSRKYRISQLMTEQPTCLFIKERFALFLKNLFDRAMRESVGCAYQENSVAINIKGFWKAVFLGLISIVK